jgi:hypothetical protein
MGNSAYHKTKQNPQHHKVNYNDCPLNETVGLMVIILSQVCYLHSCFSVFKYQSFVEACFFGIKRCKGTTFFDNFKPFLGENAETID